MPGKKLDRRIFLKMCGSAAIGSGLAFHPLNLPTTKAGKKRKERFKLSRPNWIIYNNGSYDLISEEIILKNCRPAIDGQSVIPKNVFLGDSPKGKRIVYEINGGFLMLDLKTNKYSLSIGAEFSGFSKAPRWFYPIFQAEVFGVNQFFKQGFGTGGQSGVYPIQNSSSQDWGNITGEQSWSFDSYLAFGFLGKKETIAVGNLDHKDFLQRSTIFNRPHRSGLSDRYVGGEQLFFESAMHLEETPIENEYIKLPELHFFAGNKPFETLRELAWRQSEKTEARQSSVTSYHWIPRPENEQPNSLEFLKKQINHLGVLSPTLPVHSLVIDKGYCVTGDWLDTNDNWPGGLNRAAREIFKNGYRAGIWIAPFIVAEKSKIFRQHPDWLIKDFNNQPIPEEISGQEVHYALDLSNDNVLKHLSKIFKSLKKSGFIFFETAHLNAGFKNIKKANKGKSAVQVFRNALSVIREEIGPGGLWLANHTPYAPIIGFADIVKTNNKIKRNWTDDGAGNMIQESYTSQYFNNIFWQNDPGSLHFSNNNSKFSEQEMYSLAMWNGILGGAVSTSSDITQLSNDQIDYFRFLEPNKRLRNAYFPFWPGREEIKVAVSEYRAFRSWGILFFNDKNKPVKKSFAVEDLIDETAVYVFGWKIGQTISFGELNKIIVELQPHESRLLYLSRNNAPPPPNLTIGGRISENR